MTEQTNWMIVVEYNIEIVGCLDEAINTENWDIGWLQLSHKSRQTAQQKWAKLSCSVVKK